MLNAAQVVSGLDAEKGLLSTEELKDIRSQLNVTHIFVVDSAGNFIRSTNEDPSLIPNAYSFCPAYENMIVGDVKTDSTPIIHPQPEPKPYKFLFVPNRSRTRLLEVGVRIDFIAKTLTEALGSDPNVLSMAVYDPNGTSFGSFTAKEYKFIEKKISIPEVLPAVVDDGNTFRVYTKVTSSHPKCCQCDISGTSKNGEYYYVLESVVSKHELSALMAKTKTIFITLGLAIILLSAFFGKFLVGKLVRNIELAAEKIRAIRRGDDVEGRLNIKGNDEVAFLTKEFDGLLDELNESQKKVVESEKVEAKVQLAREVGHNIRSPIIAIEMMLPTMFGLPKQAKNVLKNAVQEIKSLSEKLSETNKEFVLDMKGQQAENNLVLLPVLVDEVVQQKKIEYSGNLDLAIEFKNKCKISEGFVTIAPSELKSVISNLINNAVEAYGSSGGVISVEVESSNSSCLVTISDSGMGIPKEYIGRLGKEKITFKGGSGRGLGLPHAVDFVEENSGKLVIKSEIGVGTKVTITLPRFKEDESNLENINYESLI
ncbi:MAG: HAMP domain-containing histidine kinase [Bdellovibrionales bacterium]|nr:HAMP domain-containing histidine kinase [Bdellovibrionales bacterium]